MRVTTCYACDSERSSFYAEENGFQLVKCAGCGLLFIADRPDDSTISQAHKQGMHRGVEVLDVTGAYSPDAVGWYLSVLSDLFDGDARLHTTWLDVGCGHGEFIEAVQRRWSGAAVRGTEPNLRKQRSAQARGLDVGYFDLETHQERYHAVSMLNVYSHLPDPPAFLRSLRRVLEPGGELILQTGDTARLAAADHHRPFGLPDHLSFASEEIVVGILERLGFEVLRVRKYPYLRFSWGGFAKELVKAVLPSRTSRLKYYLRRRVYADTDMFVRARLKL